MRLASVRLEGERRVVEVDLHGTTASVLPKEVGSLDDIVRGGRAALDRVKDVLPEREVPLGSVSLLAPLSNFNRDILCTGWNYWNHFEESLGKRDGQDPESVPEHPTFFTKGPDTVIGPYDDIAFDGRLSQKWDYEAEIALIVGKDGRSIPEERAWDHIFGLCVANDVSQRDLQRRHGGQWLKGKSIDQSMPFGPWITTPDEIDDVYSLSVQCEVNGERLQDGNTAQVAFTFEQIIAELSYGMTLRSGDVILTGTPSGVGNARTPPVFLNAGDLLVTRVSTLGELRNRVTETRLI